MVIRKAEVKDLNQIVAIHFERFSGFFLTSLGRDFLKTFYKAYLKNPGVLLVLEDEGEVKGFAAGSRDNRGFFKKLLKNNFVGFAISGLKILFANPKALKRIASNIGKSEKNNFAFAELLSIATLKNKKATVKFYYRNLKMRYPKKIKKIYQFH